MNAWPDIGTVFAKQITAVFVPGLPLNKFLYECIGVDAIGEHLTGKSLGDFYFHDGRQRVDQGMFLTSAELLFVHTAHAAAHAATHVTKQLMGCIE